MPPFAKGVSLGSALFTIIGYVSRLWEASFAKFGCYAAFERAVCADLTEDNSDRIGAVSCWRGICSIDLWRQ
ncbi:hypothetical protein JOL62DRAFT_575602 [Phyllosticta paracitricarpa]|uniref:Uncharacterized protein n=1 Tax=Phyllosticta paracitricarpa TaxID=2016321 RepID=A0ABR1N9G9_9PEZI